MYQPMGCRRDYAINGMIFAIFVFFRVCLIVIGGETSSKTEIVFLFRSHDSFFLQINMDHHHQTS